MAEIKDTEILNLETSWENYAGKRIEEFIKKMFGLRIGYTDINSDSTGLTTVRCFSDEDTYAIYAADPDNHPELVISSFSFYSSGSATIDYTLVARISQVPVTTTVKGADNIIKYVYNSYYGEDTADLDAEPGYLTVTVNSTVIEALSQRLEAGGEERSINLGPYLNQETNSVKITIGNNHGKSRSWSYTLYTKEIILALDSSYDESLLRESDWNLRVACSGTVADVHLRIDDNADTEQIMSISNSTYDFNIDNDNALSYGKHTVTIYAKNVEYGIQTDTITTQFIKKGLSTPTVCIGKDATKKATMYGAASIPYFFYYPEANAGDVVTVQFETRNIANELIETLSSQRVTLEDDLTSGIQQWNLSLENEQYEGNTIIPTIIVGTDKASYRLEIEKSGITVQPASECKVFLTAKGRTNADEDAEDWHSTYNGVRTCTVVRSDNFRLNAENGFTDNKFVIRPGKRITLNGFKPFESDFGVNASIAANRTGKTIEMEIETGNCSNMDTIVCSCLNNGIGFVLYPNRVELMCSTGSVYTLFNDETRVRIGICIDGTTTHCVNNPGNSSVQPTESDCNIAYLYVNGTIVRMFDYGEAEWQQPVPQNIVIGSDECEVTLYTFRLYDKSLNYQQMLGNRAFDHPDLSEKIALAKRNDVLDSSNKVSLSKVLQALPNTPYIIWDMKEMPTSKSDPRTCDRTEFFNPLWNIDTYGHACAPFVALAHEINGDGTSSNNYPLPYKNWAEKFEFSASIENPWILHIDGQEVTVTKFSITPGLEEGETEFVHKVNFASCEKIFNMLTMNAYQDILLNVATAASGYPELLSAPQAAQEAEGKPITYRHSLSGFPEIGYRRTYDVNGNANIEFLSIYNFINNKYSASMLGYNKKSVKNQAWEVDDNINFFMTEIPEATWDSDNDEFNSLATTLYYARVPKKSPVTGNKLGVASASNQVSQANTETEALRRVHNWIYSVNPNVADRYKARYGDYRPFTEAVDGFTSKTYGDITYTKDTPAYRYDKFADEYTNYINKWSVIFYFIYFDYHLGTDSMDKNMTIACDDVTAVPAIWHPKPRDSDTLNMYNNSGLLRWKFFHEWGDSYNAATDETGTILGEIYNPQTGSYSVICSTGTPIFNGRLSGIFDCAAKVWANDIKTMYVAMRTGGMNYSSMFRKYKDYWSYWCENLYNADGMGYANTGNFNMAYGDKLEVCRYFYKYRERYWDSKCATGNSQGNALMLRLWTRGKGVALRHYCPIYASLNWGSGGVKSQRNIHTNEPAYFENGITASGSNESTFTIYDCDLVTEISTYSKDVSGNITEGGLEGLGQVDIQSNLQKCKRLQKLILRYTEDNPNIQLSNSGFDLSNCKMLRELAVTYNTSLTKSVTIYSEMIEKIDFTGSPIAGINIPSTDSLVSLKLPGTIRRLELTDFSKLSEFSIQGIDILASIKINGCQAVPTQNLIERCLSRTGGTILTSVDIDNIDWNGFSIDHLAKLCEIGAKLKGKIVLNTTNSNTLTGTQKFALINAYGNIDDPNNDLYVEYTKVSVNSVTIVNPNLVSEVGEYPLSLTITPSRGNNFISLVWSIDDNDYATINAKTGVVTVNRIGDANAAPKATVKVILTLANGATREATYLFPFYVKPLEIGDLIYSDGSYANGLVAGKTVVGICFYINPDDPTDRRMVACDDAYPNPCRISPLYPFIAGINSFNTVDGSNTNLYINENTYIYNGDFKVFPSGSAIYQMDGKSQTKIAGDYSKKILESNDLPIPTTIKEVYNAMQSDDISSGRYWAAALMCELYEPTLKYENETLNDKFKAGEWYIPSLGEIVRVIWHYMNANKNNEWSQFENILKLYYPDNTKVFNFNVASTGTRFASNTQKTTSYNGNNYFVVYFYNNQYQITDGDARTVSTYIRPICKF